MDLWKAEANVTKSHTMLFKPPSSRKRTEQAEQPTWTWGPHTLPHKHETKLLGVMFSSDCSWTLQTKYARKKGYAAYHKWRLTLQNSRLARHIKVRIISTFIKPCMTYGMEIWAPTTKADNRSLERPLTEAVRTLLGAPTGYGTTCCPVHLMLHDTNIASMESENKSHTIRYNQITQLLLDTRLQYKIHKMLPPTNA